MLVHGCRHRGWCWSRVLPVLRAAALPRELAAMLLGLAAQDA